MYEQFFGLSRRPFSAAPDADCYFPATAIEAARQTLFRCIDRGEGAALLIGPAGAGKSLLLQVLAEQFKTRFELALLASGRLSTLRELLQAILYELGLPYRELQEGELRLALIDHLSAAPRLEAAATVEREGLLLLIDEAHTLPLKLLEEVRLITNLIRGGQPKVRLVLAGSAALEERFTSPKLDTFNQRVSARCYLQPFDRSETLEYIKAQIEWAAGQPNGLFTGDALDAVYRATNGVPRLINQICDHALLLACGAGASSLDKASIERAWADLQQLPAPANQDGSDTSQTGTGDVIEFGVLDDDSISVADETMARSLDDIEDDDAAVLSIDEQSIEIDVSEPATFDVSVNEFDIQFEPIVEEPCEVAYQKHAAALRPAEFGYQDPLTSLRQVERQIAAIDSDYQSDLSPSPQIDLSFEDTLDPFRETFAEEELVIDPFAMTATDALANRPLVQCAEGHTLAAMLKPLPQRPAPKLTLAAPGDSLEFDAYEIEPSNPTYRLVADAPPTNERADRAHDAEDREPELIVIEDEPPGVHQVTVVRRGQYRRLFSSMRQG